MIQKCKSLAGGGTPDEAQNSINLHVKRTTKPSVAKAVDIEAMTVRDYVEALAFFGHRLKTETKDDPELRHLLVWAMRGSLEAVIRDCIGTEVT